MIVTFWNFLFGLFWRVMPGLVERLRFIKPRLSRARCAVGVPYSALRSRHPECREPVLQKSRVNNEYHTPDFA